MIPRADLAPFARRELGLRERHWPAAVKAGTMPSEAADADLAAWRAIDALLDQGATETDRTWDELVAAVEFALDRREEAMRAAHAGPGDAAPLEQRLALMAALTAFLRRARHVSIFGEGPLQ